VDVFGIVNIAKQAGISFYDNKPDASTRKAPASY